jgi:hypothetical protein
MKKIIITLAFEKIAVNCDLNIDPWWSFPVVLSLAADMETNVSKDRIPSGYV